MADAQRDLDRVSGDNRAEIQSELTAHQAAMRKYNSQSNGNAQIRGFIREATWHAGWKA